MLDRALAAALNHLLRDETWASDKLAPHAGKAFVLTVSPGPTLRLQIDALGRLDAASPSEPAALTVRASFTALGALARDTEAIPPGVAIEGDAALAAALRYVAARLEWDAEDDLARVVGAVPAHRLSALVRAVAAMPRDAAQRLADNAREFVHDEAGLLVGRASTDALGEGIRAAADEADALEARIAALEARMGRAH